MAWPESYVFSSSLILTIRIHCFYFAANVQIRIKGLIWEGDGFLLLYKRIENGNFRWPRTQEEALEISADQYQMLMQGLEIIARSPIEEVVDPAFSM